MPINVALSLCPSFAIKSTKWWTKNKYNFHKVNKKENILSVNVATSLIHRHSQSNNNKISFAIFKRKSFFLHFCKTFRGSIDHRFSRQSEESERKNKMKFIFGTEVVVFSPLLVSLDLNESFLIFQHSYKFKII